MHVIVTSLVAQPLPLSRLQGVIVIVVLIQLQVIVQLSVPLYHEARELVHVRRSLQQLSVPEPRQSLIASFTRCF